MSRWTIHFGIYLSLIILAGGSVAQESRAVAQTKMAVCNFDDGKQISVRYPIKLKLRAEKLPMKELWAPGGSPK